MRIKRYVLVSAAVLAAGAGGGAAIAATGGGDDDHKKAEQSILDDAAKRLNVTPDALRSALGAAEDAQLDQQVRDGRLTQAQADAIKRRRADSGEVLGPGAAGGPAGPRGPGMMHPGFGLGFKAGPGGALDGAATALGLSRDDLLKQLRAGRSIADIARAQGKSLDDVKTAITAAVTKELDQQVSDRKLTADQETKILGELRDHLDDLVNNTRPSPPAGAPKNGPNGAPQFGPRHHWR
ncbi:hypothetical protein [Conexibacter woesei]|uniref:hypothetical protein n=1 Tax=Conexibacter woesei TaxID=191495 RepID=UPI0003FE021E|nr:hypothetical protein [Conexibacter woesei]